MGEMTLRLTLVSDATFGRGEGLAGVVDLEVEHDANGLPFVRGRVLKGLLVEECANILFALRLQKAPCLPAYEEAAGFLFGSPGSTDEQQGRLHVGPALLPEHLRRAVAVGVAAGTDAPTSERLAPAEVLDSLTAIRRQTAVDEDTGAPNAGSLRALRVFLRGTVLHARLHFSRPPAQAAKGLPLLAACVLALQRGGTGRNRGRGRLAAELLDDTGGSVTLGSLSSLEADLIPPSGAATPGSPSVPAAEQGGGL